MLFLKGDYIMDKAFLDWREQWESNKVPGCAKKNCAGCSKHETEKIQCPLQLRQLRKDLADGKIKIV